MNLLYLVIVKEILMEKGVIGKDSLMLYVFMFLRQV